MNIMSMAAATVVLGILTAAYIVFLVYIENSEARKIRFFNEESGMHLEEYFRDRDNGAPPDPLLGICFREIGTLELNSQPYMIMAETAYQDELRRREKEKAHQEYLGWAAGETAPDRTGGHR